MRRQISWTNRYPASTGIFKRWLAPGASSFSCLALATILNKEWLRISPPDCCSCLKETRHRQPWTNTLSRYPASTDIRKVAGVISGLSRRENPDLDCASQPIQMLGLDHNSQRRVASDIAPGLLLLSRGDDAPTDQILWIPSKYPASPCILGKLPDYQNSPNQSHPVRTNTFSCPANMLTKG
ncbi:hypothetical protein B0H13DRAFT_2307821 [Mycena leptocephala]|nr:hypothetical protein B0H13DRAFT_2307821 [Mycena leptocephala]